MTSEEDFLQALQQGPQDDDLRLVYADWLEERGDIRGEYLRLLIQLRRIPKRLEELQPKIDPNWLMRLGCLFRLLLRSYPPDYKIQTIKCVRELTGLGLKETKDLVEKPLPQVIVEGLTREQAERARQLFQGHADVVIEPDHGTRSDRLSGEQCALPDSFCLTLRSYRPQNKIWIIKSVRELTGLGLKEAKDLVEKPLPQVIVEGLTREQVERARQSFAGYADVSIESY